VRAAAAKSGAVHKVAHSCRVDVPGHFEEWRGAAVGMREQLELGGSIGWCEALRIERCGKAVPSP
jgi:hypothetical protein